MERPNSTTFIDQLERTPDPRCARGRSYEWRVLLAIMERGLGQWPGHAAWDCPGRAEYKEALLAQLQPAKGRLPGASTRYRVYAR